MNPRTLDLAALALSLLSLALSLWLFPAFRTWRHHRRLRRAWREFNARSLTAFAARSTHPDRRH